jgi:hypothetical protein
MQEMSAWKLHEVPPDETGVPRGQPCADLLKNKVHILPADGTYAAANWRDYGKPRWQL